jgi:branched-subunit amino acid transport protein
MNRKRLLTITLIAVAVILTAEIAINIFFPTIFEHFDWYGKILMALLVTLILVFATRSLAQVSGTYLTYRFQVSGAIVVFLLIFLSSYTKDILFGSKTFNFSVQIANFNPKTMPGKMELYFLQGTLHPTAAIDANGVALFLDIPNRLRKEPLKLQLSAANNDGYRIKPPTETIVPDDQHTYSIELYREDKLTGLVMDANGSPLDSVAVHVNELDTTLLTHDGGRFTLGVPEINKQNIYHLTLRRGQTQKNEELSLNAPSEFRF